MLQKSVVDQRGNGCFGLRNPVYLLCDFSEALFQTRFLAWQLYNKARRQEIAAVPL